MQKKSFSLDSAFYPEDIILQTIEAFSECSIEFKEYTLWITDDHPEHIFDEFSNYCLALSNEQIP